MSSKRPSRKNVPITPHKGGRTIMKSALVTPEVNDLLLYLRQKHGISLGDLIEEVVKRKYEELKDP